jgi:hypothetical protein
MVEASVHLRFSSDGKVDDNDLYGFSHKDYLNIDMHWRENHEDFATWALKKYPDAVYINITIWCETNNNCRTPCKEEFDTRDFCEEIDGAGWYIQDQPQYRWKKKSDGLWWELADRSCGLWYPSIEVHSPPFDKLADFLNLDQGDVHKPRLYCDFDL